MHESKLPHSLRITIFFMRVVLGLNFFYLGYSTLFNPKMEVALSQKALAPLYAWFRVSSHPWIVPFEWALLIVGICLIAGLMTRVAALAGFAIVAFIYWPYIDLLNLSVSQFITDYLLALLGLLVVLFGRAGSYIGLDSFFHFSMFKKKQ